MTGYIGSHDILTASKNEEIVPKAPSNWTVDRYELRKFSFINYSPTKVSINGGSPIYLDENQGFDIGRADPSINSFIILDDDVKYSWVGVY